MLLKVVFTFLLLDEVLKRKLTRSTYCVVVCYALTFVLVGKNRKCDISKEIQQTTSGTSLRNGFIVFS